MSVAWLAIPDAAVVAGVLGGPLVLAALAGARAAHRHLAALAPFAALPACLLALVGPRTFTVRWDGLMLGATFGIDALSHPLLVAAAIIWLVAGLYAAAHHAHDPRRARIVAFLLAAMSGNLGAILAQDLLTFYLCFSWMGFAGYGLVVHEGTASARRAGLVYIGLAVAADVVLVDAMTVLASRAGSFAFADVASVEMGLVTTALVLVGFAIKAGLFPVHVWLPLAHAEAPTPANAVLSGAMVQVGVLGWWRMLPATGPEADWAGTALVALGAVTALGGVLVGLLQARPNSVLAYSTVNQVGLLAIGSGLMLWEPSIRPAALLVLPLIALHHGLSKGALFLGVGVGAATPASGALRAVVWIGLGLMALSLAAFPGTSGAWATQALRLLVNGAAGSAAPWLAATLTASSLGSALLMARFLTVLEFNSPGAPGNAFGRLCLPLAALVALSALLPLWGPYLLAPAVSAPEVDLLAALPVMAAAGAAVLVLIASRRLEWLRRLRLPPGDVVMLVSWIAAATADLAQGAGAAVAGARNVLERFAAAMAARLWRDGMAVLLTRGERTLALVAGLAFGALLVLLSILQAGGS